MQLASGKGGISVSSPIERVLALCDKWDKLTHGESSTTQQIREEAKPQPGDMPLLPIPSLADLDPDEVERIKDQLRNPSRIFVLPRDDSLDFEIIDTEQLELPWGDEPCE